MANTSIFSGVDFNFIVHRLLNEVDGKRAQGMEPRRLNPTTLGARVRCRQSRYTVYTMLTRAWRLAVMSMTA